MSKHGNYLLLIAGALLATNCVDDPVSVDEQPIEAIGGPLAHAQYQDGEDPDPFRARLEVDFEVQGDLEPNTPITVWIEAVATEDISGGEVQVALPTFAAMELAGSDKRPKYVPGGKVPVVASWPLPKMDAGDQWKQSVEIGSVTEKGYYQIVTLARAEGPYKSPYVFDDSFREAWMFVVDGRGLLTPMFDETIFPDRIIPQPGPFEPWLQYQTTSADAVPSDASATAGAPPSTIRVYFSTYDQHNTNIPMTGAAIRAEYIERGRVVSIITRTVPDNGIVEFNCPGDDQRISGTAKNSTTSKVYGGHLLSYWQANRGDCGRTKDVYGARHLYLPWRNLEYYAIPRINSLFGYSRSTIRFKVDVDNDHATCSPFKDRIKFGVDYGHLSVAGHEYTHGLHNKALGGTWRVLIRNCAGHRVNIPSSYKCALREGLAAFGGQVAVNRTGSYWEHFHRHPPYGRGAGEIEGNVAALFYDLLDSSNEHGDDTTYPGRYVFAVFKTCRTPNSQRDDTADFVWCLERQVVDSVHNRHFPGLSPPSGVRELATEPGNWNRDDIRSTWIWNVGRSGG